jgi:hypothetical protein
VLDVANQYSTLNLRCINGSRPSHDDQVVSAASLPVQAFGLLNFLEVCRELAMHFCSITCACCLLWLLLLMQVFDLLLSMSDFATFKELMLDTRRWVQHSASPCACSLPHTLHEGQQRLRA